MPLLVEGYRGARRPLPPLATPGNHGPKSCSLVYSARRCRATARPNRARSEERGAQPFFAGFLAGAFFAGAGAALAAAFFAGAFLAALGAAFAGAAAFFAAFLAGGGAAAGALLSHTPSAAPAGSMKMPIAPISPISM